MPNPDVVRKQLGNSFASASFEREAAGRVRTRHAELLNGMSVRLDRGAPCGVVHWQSG